MSGSSSERLKEDTTSMDEDSGHDSVDDISTPADERERIASLETAVSWIRDEVSQLKEYDKDILQELWKIRNTIHNLRENGKKPSKEELKYLDESIEDRSPTPESIQNGIDHYHGHHQNDNPSPPPSPSPSPEYLAPDGSGYRRGTLQLMASAPEHLRKESDDEVLENFFGSDQLTKLDIFKSQVSVDATNDEDVCGESIDQFGGGLMSLGGLMQGVSMPNISSNPTISPPTISPPTPTTTSSYSGVVKHQEGQKPRLRIPVVSRTTTNRLSGDANRVSCDVASEMEKLRARLQETAMQELAEFDRKFSPKLHHSSVLGVDGNNRGSGNHSRQGSLDSSNLGTNPGGGGGGGGVPLRLMGHTRQHSLPIDPRTSSHGWNLSSSSSGNNVERNERSPTPPMMYGHIRQVSGGSMSSEGSSFSPTQNIPYQLHHQGPNMGTRGGGGGVLNSKQSKPPGMMRVSSNGSSKQGSSSNSLSAAANRSSPESEGRAAHEVQSSRPLSGQYSTTVLKRPKRNSQDLSTSASLQQQQQQQRQLGGNVGVVSGRYQGYERKPHTYERPVNRNSYGDDMDPEVKHVAMPNYGGAGGGGSRAGRFNQLSPPRIEGTVHSSPKMARAAPDSRRSTVSEVSRHQNKPTGIPARPQAKIVSQMSLGTNNASMHADDIQPYMTSSHLKSQMQANNFSYTPFSSQPSSHLQPRSSTVSSGGEAPPKLSKQKGGVGVRKSKQTWI